MKVAVIGGGAAGFFSALSVKEHHPNAEVEVIEKSTKLLSKVKVSGGGRCNVTHNCFKISELIKFYPRGGKQLKKPFSIFYTKHTVEWFRKRSIELKTEDDNRMFPVTNSSQTIIDCFLDEAYKLGIQIKKGVQVLGIYPKAEGFDVLIDQNTEHYDKIIVSTGGSPKKSGLDWLEELGLKISEPVPSLFTFNTPNNDILSLQGLVAPNVLVKVEGIKENSLGPVLITHWGMSGPGVLKLSSLAARTLAEKDYLFNAQINWTGISNEDQVRNQLQEAINQAPKKQIGNINPFEFPNRLWDFLLKKTGIETHQIAGELSKKIKNQLVNHLVNDTYPVEGKTTFKEEFVTCGGVALENIDLKTMMAKTVPGLYFAGEVLDIDGVTGGFNFQAAWTTGFIAGRLESPQS